MSDHALLTYGGIATFLLGAVGAAYGQDARGQMPGTVDAYATGAAGGATFATTQDLGSDASYSGLSLEGGASAEYNATATLGFQGDVRFRYYVHGAPAGDFTYGSTDKHFDAAAHGFYRNREELLGGFVQVSGDNVDYTFSDGTDQPVTATTTYAGLEGQKFFHNVTLYGQLAAMRVTQTYGPPYGGFVGAAELRYFVEPNLRVDMHGQYVRMSDNAGDVESIAIVGIGGEYRLDQSRVSFTGSLDYAATKSESSSGATYTEDHLRALIGLKVDLGSGTLADQDRSGASLKPIQPPFEGGAGYWTTN
ncbi:MAG: hypothetical protein P4M09_27365 [Devosia sp.]|nr:hypothetical protein [Devosia sp.]